MLDDVRRLLVRELEAFAREVELFPDDETTGDARTSGAVSLKALADG